MSGTLFRAAFPSGPIATASGIVTDAWRGFFQSLYARTGSANGVSSDTSQLEAELEAERAARIAADAAEVAARQKAIAAEALARQNADTAEARARAAADALLVPIAQLCSMWAACNLAFLPTADPGGGKPWLDGNHIAVGTPSIAVVDIGLEDGAGGWALQDGTGHWQWG